MYFFFKHCPPALKPSRKYYAYFNIRIIFPEVRPPTMDRIVFAAVMLSVATCQQLQQRQQSSVDPNPQGPPPQTAAGGPTGFVPIMTEELKPETSSVQSRDYSGGSEFYGYNYPASYGPPSYGPPSSSYGSPGKSNKNLYRN